MRYAKSRYEKNQRELVYRIYVTDALHEGLNLDRRYYDIINGMGEQKQKTLPVNAVEENQKAVSRLMAKFRD